jgi:hypothetical protein
MVDNLQLGHSGCRQLQCDLPADGTYANHGRCRFGECLWRNDSLLPGKPTVVSNHLKNLS